MKRVLSLFLSCIFVLGVCFSTPIVASATDGDTTEPETLVGTEFGETSRYEILSVAGDETQDTCALIKYVGTDAETNITVSGEASYNDVPYTVTQINTDAFSGCTTLETITIKSNIETIEAGAFVGCTALTAFIESSESQNAKFEVVDGVLFNADKTTLIAYPAAKEGTEYTIPATVTEIADGAFAGCSALTAFALTGENNSFYVSDGVLFNKAVTKLIAYPADKEGTEYTIPATVTEIAANAFSGADITLFSENPGGITNPDGLVIHKVITEGEHTVNGYVISGNEINKVCSCGVELETIAMMMYDGVFTDTNDKKWAKNATINAASEYTLSLNVEGAYNANLSIETMDNSELSFWAKKGEEVAQKVTVDLGVELDSIAPTGTITLDENNIWTSLAETITFGLFFKTEKNVTIEANDAGSGVKSVEYYIAETNKLLSELETLGENSWTKATLVDGCVSVNLKQNSKNIVYARITDNVGNVTYISSNGIVLYSDSITTTENIEYTKFSNVPVSVNIDLNGNTIKEVKNGDEIFTVNDDYTVKESDGVATITFLSEMLDGLSIGESQITISYNPLGVSSGEDDITIPFTINKATPIFTAPTGKTNLEFTGSTQPLINAGTTNLGELEYSLDNTNWSTAIPMGTEAGEYTVYYRVESTDDYNGVEGDFKVTIAPKTITATIEPIADQIYTGSAIEPTVVVKDGETVLSAGTDYVVIYSANTNVGTATVSVTLKGNYSGTATATFKIVEHVHSWNFDAVDGEGNENKIKATCEGAGSCIYQTEGVTITLEAPKAPAGETSLVYDGSEKVATVTISAENTGITPDVVYTSKTEGVQLVEGKCINAGDYTASITLLGKDETIVTVSFTIEKATATFTVPTANTELTYSGQPQALVTAGTTTGGTMQYKLGETGDWSIEIPTGTDAGTYKVYYKVVGNENYDGVDYSENNFVEVKIAPKTITATLTQDSGVYNESAHEPAVEFGGLCENEILEKIIDYTVSYTDNTNVGTATVTVKLCDASTAKNYTFANNAKTTTLNYTITKGVASINETPIANELTYTGTEQELVTAGSATGGTIYYTLTPTDENSWSVDVPTATKAGTYKVFYKVIGNENYDGIDYSESNFVEVKIAKKVISTIIIGGIDAETYTGLQLTPSVNVSIPAETPIGVATLPSTEYTLTYGENVNAGTGTVTVVLSDNYEYTGNHEDLTVTFTINKATPNVEKFAFTAPENLTYDGNEKTATVVVKDGITGMGAITIKYYDSEGEEVTPKAEGTYTVKIYVADGTNFVEANEITSNDWEFTIKAHEHDWKYTASGAVITATCQNNGCDIKTTTVELVAPENLVYNGTEKSVTVKAPHADLLSEYTLSHATGADVGTYTAYLSIGEGDKVVTVQKSFTITPALIVVTKVTAIDRVYDGNLVVSINKTDGIVYTGLIDGDKVGFDLSALTGTLSDANVGSNKTVKVNGSIVLTGEDAKNYVVSTPGVTNVNITPATVTITPDAKTSEQYYGLPALTYKVTGFIGADTLTKAPTLTTNADIKKTGDYTITAAGAEASANYVIKYATAPLTITAHKNHIVKDGTWKETVHGTCMVAGKEAGTCTLCGGTITRDSKTDPNNHTLITTVTKFQTCTQNGEALVTCANGCKYSLKTAVPADGKSHNFAKDFTVIESTCVAKGSKFKACENEGCKEVAEKSEIAINPDAHKNIVTINAKEATCEKKGYTGDEFCNDCKKTIDPGIEINAKGHTESDWIVDKEATFTEEGAKHTACTVCNKELKKEVIAKRALETPEVKIENVSNGIKVSWSQDEDAAGYTVYSSIYNASTKKWSAWKNRGTAAANRSSWTDKTVTEGVTYRYTVRAVNGSNRSAYKATAGLLYVSAPKVTVTISSTGLLAKWNKVNNATGYIVYRRALVNGVWSSWVNLGTTAPEKNSWFDSNVQSGVSYRYTVRAVVNKVRGGYIASSAVIYLAQPLLKISNATAGVAGKWEPIAGATGYTIYRSEYNPSTEKWTKWLTLGTTGATAKTFTDKTVKSGYKYKYTIRAVNGKFRSTYQDSNKLVYLAQPTLKISNVANGIQGSWNQVNGATGYIIYRRELKDGKWSNWTSLGTTKATAKTFTDKTVKSGVTYRYTVRATNGVDRSSYASTGSLVFLSVPTVKISSGITGVNVSWSKIDGATSYLVYRREIANGKWTGWSRITTVTETSFVDETAKSGTYYRYTVRALNGKSSSKFTSTSTLYYLATPIVTVAKIDDGIKVNWTQVTGVTGYTIYRAQLGADGKWSKWVTLGTATDKYSSCKDKTAKTGVTYKYTVRAVNGKVRSAYIDGAQIVNTVQ